MMTGQRPIMTTSRQGIRWEQHGVSRELYFRLGCWSFALAAMSILVTRNFVLLFAVLSNRDRNIRNDTLPSAFNTPIIAHNNEKTVGVPSSFRTDAITNPLGVTFSDKGHYQAGNGRHSPVCYPRLLHGNTVVRRIFFGHMRKAGGSTLRAYFTNVTQKYDLEFEFSEGTRIEEPGKRMDTIYITHVRDPVSRIISHYKYEGRWPCDQLVFNKSQFVPTMDNSMRFERWIASADHNGTCSSSRLRQIGWKCTSNCYIRWINFPRGFCKRSEELSMHHQPPKQQQGKFNNLYSRAQFRAYNFDVIIDIERLSRDSTYSSGIERMFGLDGLGKSKLGMFCGKRSRLANKLVPFQVSNRTLKELYMTNEPDYNLYNELISCPNGIIFPNQVLSDYVKSKI